MTVVPARPPRSWETQTLALMAATGRFVRKRAMD